jgi:hypothetical protein
MPSLLKAVKESLNEKASSLWYLLSLWFYFWAFSICCQLELYEPSFQLCYISYAIFWS